MTKVTVVPVVMVSVLGLTPAAVMVTVLFVEVEVLVVNEPVVLELTALMIASLETLAVTLVLPEVTVVFAKQPAPRTVIAAAMDTKVRTFLCILLSN